MDVASILTVARIRTGLTVADKDAALRSMAGLFPGLDPDRVYRAFAEREALGSTGAGSGVAIPHGRMREAPALQAAVGIVPEGVEFQSVDDEPVKILVAIVAPDPGDHLRALARFARVLRPDGVRAELVEAADSAAILAIMMREESHFARRP
jgi:PTS system nitrogen regulatory IIA component